jgi:phospholipid:diacylglycerol acyltransferase
MHAVRRRLNRGAGTPPEEQSRQGTPDSERLPAKRQLTLQSRSTWGTGTKRRHAWVFVLGGLCGLLLATFLANNNDLIDLAGLNLDQFVDVLPAGFMSDINEFQVSWMHPFMCLA